MAKNKPISNSLAVIYPELSSEWHPTKNGALTPDVITTGSHKKVWWLGPCGHEWQAEVCNRANGTGCPVCSNKQLATGINDLATKNPELAAEWHPTKNGELTPQMVAPKSNKKVWWLCTEGHEWQAKCLDRSNGHGCPYCSHLYVFRGEIDLATNNPVLATEWHPTKNGELNSDNVTPGSSKRVWWVCENGHEWQAAPKTRTKGYGCPYCSGQRSIEGETDLATTYPELAAQWHPTKNGELTLSQVKIGSDRKVWWLGPCGHEWQAVIKNRSKLGHGCPICARVKRVETWRKNKNK